METFLLIVDRFKIRATLFVSGVLADTFATEIASYSSSGHEIASHGFDHRIDYRILSAEKLFSQLERSKKALEECTGHRIIGFRTPQLVQNPSLPDLLTRAGYLYDSSLARTSIPGRYSNRGIPTEPYLRGEILEIPVDRVPLLPLPFGLLWTNLLGSSCYRLLSGLRDNGSTLRVFYLHPFDLVEKHWNREMKAHVNFFYLFRSRSTVNTFQDILDIGVQRGFEFTRLCDVYEDYRKKANVL
jgi:peptidoglycan/xylan/chitin deacetylase (PgdA/CDA1 family)